MMYAGFYAKSKQSVNILALVGLLILIAFNGYEIIAGMSVFSFDTKGMLYHSNYGLIFLTIIQCATLIYFLLSGRDGIFIIHFVIVLIDMLVF